MAKNAAVDREKFKVTDTSPPPLPSIAYSGCGSQTIATDCLIIPISGGDGGESAPQPGENVVYRMLSSTRTLDDVMFRHSTFTSQQTASRLLPQVSSDVATITELISSDPSKTVTEVVADTKEPKRAYLQKIRSFLESCEETAGALIWFAGHAQSNTGDWVFQNDTITFEEVLGLYENLFFNRILYIVCDCCYSGRWVTKLAERLDGMGIGACGHEAKRVGYFLKIIASCGEGQYAVDGCYVKANGFSSAEDGSVRFSHNKILRGSQCTMALDTTSMRCFRDPSADCILHKLERQHQWKWVDLVKESSNLSKRFQFVCTNTHWYAVLFHKDKCDSLFRITERRLSHCGFIVAKGPEEFPPKEVQSKLCLYSPMNIDPNNLPEVNADPTAYYY